MPWTVIPIICSRQFDICALYFDQLDFKRHAFPVQFSPLINPRKTTHFWTDRKNCRGIKLCALFLKTIDTDSAKHTNFLLGIENLALSSFLLFHNIWISTLRLLFRICSKACEVKFRVFCDLVPHPNGLAFSLPILALFIRFDLICLYQNV
jgi:hypothetical protein